MKQDGALINYFFPNGGKKYESHKSSSSQSKRYCSASWIIQVAWRQTSYDKKRRMEQQRTDERLSNGVLLLFSLLKPHIPTWYAGNIRYGPQSAEPEEENL